MYLLPADLSLPPLKGALRLPFIQLLIYIAIYIYMYIYIHLHTSMYIYIYKYINIYIYTCFPRISPCRLSKERFVSPLFSY